MENSAAAPAVLFIDFDGTITQRDVIDALLELYAAPEWMEIEERWRAGQIGSRECLRAQMAFVSASPRQIDELVDSMEVDEGFLALLDTCATHNVAAHIVSDGFDYCIHRFLRRSQFDRSRRLMRDVRIWSSHLEPDEGGRWIIDFPYFAKPCVHDCATCKPAVMRTLRRDELAGVFVGDGLSDRYAAQDADIVFARSNLAAYCEEQSIACTVFENLSEVGAALEARWGCRDTDPGGSLITAGAW